MKLHLGVVEVPYAGQGGQTTGDVAEILEDKYGVMATFFALRGNEIAGALEEGLKAQIENVVLGAPISPAPFRGACDDIEALFRGMLDARAFDGVIPGVPTEAALKGVDHRKKRPYLKANPARPSFRDTGLYQANFAVWVEE